MESMSWWIRLDWVSKNGPMSNSGVSHPSWRLEPLTHLRNRALDFRQPAICRTDLHVLQLAGINLTHSFIKHKQE